MLDGSRAILRVQILSSNPVEPKFVRQFLLRQFWRWSNARNRVVLAAISDLRADCQMSQTKVEALNARLDQMADRLADLQKAQAETASRELQDIRLGIGGILEEARARNRHVNHYLPGRKYESFDVAFFARIRAAMASADYFNTHLYARPVFDNSDGLILHCLDLLGDGISLPLEFGVFSGRTINLMADKLGPGVDIHGFDSLEGLPETWRSNFRQGHFSRPELPAVRPNVHLVKGWFSETLPGFKTRVMGSGKTNFIHMDCDLYSSTSTVFNELTDHIADDAIIVFDEFFNYPGWEQHEIKAFDEFLTRTGRRFEFIGSVPLHQQVAVRLIP